MLQKNVLEYLEGSAARFPDKLAFTDEVESQTPEGTPRKT